MQKERKRYLLLSSIFVVANLGGRFLQKEFVLDVLQNAVLVAHKKMNEDVRKLLFDQFYSLE